VIDILNKNLFLIKKHYSRGLSAEGKNFDICDPSNGKVVMVSRELRMGFLKRNLRLADHNNILPFDIEILTSDGEPIIQIRKGFSILLSKVTVSDNKNNPIGGFKNIFFNMDGGIELRTKNNNVVCQLERNKFSPVSYFKNNSVELAHVSKKYTGTGIEMLYREDDYVLEISEDIPHNSDIRKLILAVVVCMELILK
jgi:uncharacterized protein YxjI